MSRRSGSGLPASQMVSSVGVCCLGIPAERRTTKRGRFGAVKHVYPRDTMAELRAWFEAAIADRLPVGRLLYWT